VSDITPLRSPLPAKWHLKPLGAMCSKIGSGATPRGGSASYLGSGVTFIRSQNVLDHAFTRKGLVFINDEAARKLAGVSVQPRDVLLNITGDGDTIARCCVVPEDILPARVNQHVVIIRPRDELIPEFLQRYLSHPMIREYMLSHNSGGSRRALTKGQIENFEIVIPPIKIQSAITDVLGVLDDKIAVNDRIARTARELARAHFHDSHEPMDRVELNLGSVVEFLNRGVAPRYTEDSSQLRVLNQKCVRDGRATLEPSRWTLSDKIPRGKMLKVNDVLVNSTGFGTLGRVARWTRREACTVDSHVTIVRFDPAKIDPVCAGFAMLDAEPEIESLGQGSTGQTELSRTQLSGLRITVPFRENAARLRPMLDALESRGDSALEESLSLAQLRDTLLPRLMSGEIRVRDAEKVVEDVT
jgi:type I restriction enzyme, S subunit